MENQSFMVIYELIFADFSLLNFLIHCLRFHFVFVSYRALIRYIKLLLLVRRCQRKNVAVSDLFNQYVAKHPQKPCLIYDGHEWTFRDINEFSNRIANLFQQHGYKKGDVVGLFMENRPEFVATWLGLSKIGVIVPLINTNQRQASLIHSIEIAKCQALIYSESLASGEFQFKTIEKN